MQNPSLPGMAVSRRTLMAALPALMAAQPGSVSASLVRAQGTADGARERLRDMLSLVPISALGEQNMTERLFDWVDYRTQLDALGATDPYADPAAIPGMLEPLFTSDRVGSNVLEPGIDEMLGVRPLDVHQVLVAGVMPETVMIYRGGFSSNHLAAHWESAGYRRVPGAHGAFWTLGEVGEIDLRSDFQKIVLNTMHNAAIIDDDTVVFCPTAELVQSVLALGAGHGMRASDDEEIGALIAKVPEDAVCVVAMPGTAFQAETMLPIEFGSGSLPTLDELLEESDAAVGPMPMVLLSFSGVSAGAMWGNGAAVAGRRTGDAFAFMLALTLSPEDAENGARVASWRFENMISPIMGDPYSKRFVPMMPADESFEDEVVILQFQGDAANERLWMSLLQSDDAWPIAWRI